MINISLHIRNSEVKYSKCQDLPKFQCSRGRGGDFSGTKFQNRDVLENLDKNLLFEVNCTETCLCITDSLSHTTYVETKKSGANVEKCDQLIHHVWGKNLPIN